MQQPVTPKPQTGPKTRRAIERRRVVLDRESVRVYRLYHAQSKRFFMWRYYVRKERALHQALWIAKWLNVGETVEVIDIRNGQLHGSYTRRVSMIEFQGETLTLSADAFTTLQKIQKEPSK